MSSSGEGGKRGCLVQHQIIVGEEYLRENPANDAHSQQDGSPTLACYHRRFVVRSGGFSPPHRPQQSTEAQGQYQQQTDEYCRVEHNGSDTVATRFEEHPGNEQDVEQQDQGGGTPEGVRLGAILW